MQLHLYLPKDVAAEVKRRAQAKRMTVSGYLAEIVKSQVQDRWPEDYFQKVIGGWSGKPLTRPPQGRPERREDL